MEQSTVYDMGVWYCDNKQYNTFYMVVPTGLVIREVNRYCDSTSVALCFCPTEMQAAKTFLARVKAK